MTNTSDESGSNLTRLAYARISSAIVDGRLDFGEPLSEIELAKALGMSKSPVRNAIKELEVRGLVEIVPQSGTYVFSPTEEQVVEISEFRTILEEQALQLAFERNRETLLAELAEIVDLMQRLWAQGTATEMKRADSRFHAALIRHAGNAYLSAAYADVGLLVEALRYRFMDTVSYRNRAFEEHVRMLDLLRKDNVRKAVQVLRAHTERTREFQSRAHWSNGRASRKTYRTRDYPNILAATVE